MEKNMVKEWTGNVNTLNYGHLCTVEGVSMKLLVERADAVYLHVKGERFTLEHTPHLEQDMDEWSIELTGQFHNEEYLVEVVRGEAVEFSIDPWAKSTNTNSQKGVFINMEETNPIGWDSYQATTQEDAILYEAHVRDFTSHPAFDSQEVGAFNRFGDDSANGIQHLKELGITHIHLLPIFDFTSVDDTNVEGTYNWGYDPFLFNAPEGSYSSDSTIGSTRIEELKKMIQTLHDNDIAVVMDVVYNHTSHERKNPLHVFFPTHAYRMYANGEWGNGSGCGNELKTEHPVIRAFIVESLLYWQKEFHIDGFRFDLMSLYDTETMVAIEEALREHNPNVILYGEPWTGGVSALYLEKQFGKGHQWDTRIALFNDEFRNGMKGDNDGYERGLIAGNEYHQLAVLRGMLGSIQYNEWIGGFAKDPIQSINYVSAHDNLCLFDKIEKSCPDFAYTDRVRLNKFAISLLLTSQGIPFLAQGTEFLHNKKGHHNSYNAGDDINQIDWERKKDNESVVGFTRDLIRFRKDQTALRMGNANDVRKRTALVYNEHKLLGVSFCGAEEGDYENILVVHNFNDFNHNVTLPDGEWLLIGYDGEMDLAGMEWVKGSFQLPYYSTCILAKL
ncbi:type I pullulanase [Rossellomorea marisflavi]|uniref:type I pullulanase n=1 Tax=Rossellomorea marisflavi TaxID=189381 RepID=UPI003FA03275